MSEEKRHNTIYQYTNISGDDEHGFIYIGQHTSNYENLDDDPYTTSSIILKNQVRKHPHKFKRKILFNFPYNWQKMDDKEAELVDETFRDRPDTYNLKTGGQAGLPSQETKERMGKAKSGKNSFFYGQDRSGKNNTMYGKRGELSPLFGRKKPDFSKRMKSDGNPNFKYSVESLKLLYDSTKTVCQNTTIEGKIRSYLYIPLVKYIVENNLPHVPNQRCIHNYKVKHGIVV